jgi:thioredoxin 1
VTDATFGRRVLASPLPVLVAFGAAQCSASRALLSILHELAAAYAGTIRIASIDAERDSWLAEQFGVAATPTVLVVQGGEVVTRVVGFVAAGLLRLLCAQVAAGTLPPDPFWSPTEATFEDIVLLPLLDTWNLTYVRQAPCPAPARWRIDILIYDDPPGPPLTLFENKRQLLSAQALRQAVGQANRYAQALDLASFVVAAPAGLWIYARSRAQVMAVRQISSLALEQQPDTVPQILRRLKL